MLKYWRVQLVVSNNEKDLWSMEFPFYTKGDESPHPHYERLKEEFKEMAVEEIEELNEENTSVNFGKYGACNTDRNAFEKLGGKIKPEDIEEADKQETEKATI